MSTEESATQYAGITNILRKKKIWEHSALKAAKLKQEERMAKANDAGTKEREQSELMARETATIKAKEIRNELNKLFLQQTEVEKSVQYRWKEKIDEFERRSIREEQEEMNKLREEHDSEMKQLVERVRVENEIEEEKKISAIAALGESRRGDKRKAETQGGEGAVVESCKKRKVEGGSTDEKVEGGGDATTLKGNNENPEHDNNIDTSGNNETSEKESTKKEKELEEIVEEMNYLNKTKSQMIWLLKQVITAEAKQKLKQLKR